MDRIAILIPCYNEESTIAQVVIDCRKWLPEAAIYVYDNNSSDNTAQVARDAGATHVCHERRQGKGCVLRSMFADIEAECYLMIDGDNTYPLDVAAEMCRCVLEEGYDMVVGDRLSSTYFGENKRPFHGFGNKLMRFLINRLFDSNVRDIMTGYRALSRKFVKGFPVLSQGFEIETEMTIHALDKNFLIKEIPVQYRDRPQGSTSKLNTISDGYRVVITALQLYRDYRPLRFFSMLSLLLILWAAILMIPVLLEYAETGLVPRFPTLIVVGFITLFASLLYMCGLLLEVISKKHRQQYELIVRLKS